MANFIYNSARQLFAEGKIDWSYVTGSPRTTPFTDYKIMAAMVNKTGGTGIQVYTPPAPDADTLRYVPTTTRNMLSEFGYGSVQASSSLVRDGDGAVITAELTTRAFVGATGACTSANITFKSVPVNATTYGTIESMVIYMQNLAGGASTDGSDWPVIAFIDTISSGAMAIVPNGGDIVVQWNASGIFRL